MAVVVITGCSSGLGPLTALAFARRGDRVYATMRGAPRGRDLLEAAAAEDLDVRVLELDVNDDASVKAAVSQVLQAEGRIDVVVNNAGLVHLGSVELLPDELLRATFETNLYGPVRVLRAVLPTMRARRSGVIVNVSSVAGRVAGVPIHWSYMASKHGLSVLSDALAFEVEPFGIRVISIEPGFFKTDIFAKGARPAAGDSPYRTLEDAVVAFMDGGIAGAADAHLIAQVIVDAVERDDGRIHVLVGDDAQFFMSQSQSLTDAELAAFYKEAIGVDTAAAADATL
jgi:NAD(P)-dependent dehydrogenase (short-subunit alcohol dehydrogenase family)